MAIGSNSSRLSGSPSGRLSDFKLNRELQQASSAFLAGFRRLIEERWLHMFSEDELQQVGGGEVGLGGSHLEALLRDTMKRCML